MKGVIVKIWYEIIINASQNIREKFGHITVT